MKGERRTEEEDVSFLEALEEIFILIVFTVVDRRAVMSREERETVIEFVDYLVRRLGMDEIVESDRNVTILALVAIVLAFAIFSMVIGLLGK